MLVLILLLLMGMIKVTFMGAHPTPGTVLSTLYGMLFNPHSNSVKSLLLPPFSR